MHHVINVIYKIADNADSRNILEFIPGIVHTVRKPQTPEFFLNAPLFLDPALDVVYGAGNGPFLIQGVV